MQMKMQLEATLDALNASTMVIGHTPQMSGVNAECDGRVWRVDAGMSSGVLNAVPQILEFSRDAEGRLQARMIYAPQRGQVQSSPTYVYDAGNDGGREGDGENGAQGAPAA